MCHKTKPNQTFYPQNIYSINTFSIFKKKAIPKKWYPRYDTVTSLSDKTPVLELWCVDYSFIVITPRFILDGSIY